jgi:hypothetical protein
MIPNNALSLQKHDEAGESFLPLFDVTVEYAGQQWACQYFFPSFKSLYRKIETDASVGTLPFPEDKKARAEGSMEDQVEAAEECRKQLDNFIEELCSRPLSVSAQAHISCFLQVVT